MFKDERYWGKQVIERPRSGSRNRNAKVRKFGKIVKDPDYGYEYYGATKIPMSMNGRAYGWDSKGFSDVLGPVTGFLVSQVGKPWDEVYSILKRRLGGFSWPLQHILKFHVDVDANTYRGVDGNIWVCEKNGVSCLSRKYSSHRPEFYVEPETRRLRMLPFRKSGWRWKSKIERKASEVVRIPDGRSMVKINGQWYMGRYVRSPYRSAVYRPKRKYEYTSSPNGMVQEYSAEWPNYIDGDDTMVFTGKRQASRKEIRRFRLLALKP